MKIGAYEVTVITGANETYITLFKPGCGDDVTYVTISLTEFNQMAEFANEYARKTRTK